MIVKNWRTILRRSASVILSYIATVTSVVGGGLYLMSARLGAELTFQLIVACALVSATCTAAIPLARIFRQKGINDADQ